MSASGLPADIVKIAGYFAGYAENSGGKLSVHELAKMKASLMNEPRRWARLRVTPEAFEAQCREAGLGATDAARLREYLERAQAGKKLVPNGHHKFAFAIPYEPMD